MNRVAVVKSGDKRSLSVELPAGFAGIEATLGIMKAAAKHGAIVEPRLLALPQTAIEMWQWCKRSVRFRPDPWNIEHVRHPTDLFDMIEHVGDRPIEIDCDDLAVLIAAWAIARMRIWPVFFIAAKPGQGYSHVYAGLGKAIPFDPQDAAAIGAHPPNASSIRVYPLS